MKAEGSEASLRSETADVGGAVFDGADSDVAILKEVEFHGCLNSFGILVKNRLLARAAQNGVSMFVSVYRAATARERSFRDVPPETV